MGFESNFGKNRNALADTLKQKRAEGPGGATEARSILAEEKETESYATGKALHGINKVIPAEHTEAAFRGMEREALPEGWKEEDISSLIPEKYKELLDISLMTEAAGAHQATLEAGNSDSLQKVEDTLYKLRFGRSPLEAYTTNTEGVQSHDSAISDEVNSVIDVAIEKERTEAQEFWDTVTDHRFLDPHNLNHFINAETSKTFEGQFNPRASIEPG